MSTFTPQQTGGNQLFLAISKDGGAIFDPARDLLFKLTPVAAQIWKCLLAGISHSDTVIEIAELYQVDPNIVDADLRRMLSEAAQMGITPNSVVLAASEAGPDLPAVDERVIQRDESKPPLLMILWALFGLAIFDFVLIVFSMQTMCRVVKSWPSRGPKPKDETACINKVCKAVARACVWFPHKAVCLQRTAVTACMLRAYGVTAKMVLGVRPMPFLAHAWAEVDGVVVNDRPQVKRFYQILTEY